MVLMNFMWEILHKPPLVLPLSCWRHIFDGWKGFVGISNNEGYTSSLQLLVWPITPHTLASYQRKASSSSTL